VANASASTLGVEVYILVTFISEITHSI